MKKGNSQFRKLTKPLDRKDKQGQGKRWEMGVNLDET